jgi:hypothetical protein
MSSGSICDDVDVENEADDIGCISFAMMRRAGCFTVERFGRSPLGPRANLALTLMDVLLCSACNCDTRWLLVSRTPSTTGAPPSLHVTLMRDIKPAHLASIVPAKDDLRQSVNHSTSSPSNPTQSVRVNGVRFLP